MALSVMQDRQGPDWPLGAIIVVTPGTPVSIMSLVDPTNANSPNTVSSSVASGTAVGDEYSPTVQQIMFQGFKAGVSHGMVANTGNIYIVRKGNAGGGNRDDYGAIVAVLLPQQTIFLASGARNRNTFSPYRYFIDGDTANDSALVTLIPQ